MSPYNKAQLPVYVYSLMRTYFKSMSAGANDLPNRAPMVIRKKIIVPRCVWKWERSRRCCLIIVYISFPIPNVWSTNWTKLSYFNHVQWLKFYHQKSCIRVGSRVPRWQKWNISMLSSATFMKLIPNTATTMRTLSYRNRILIIICFWFTMKCQFFTFRNKIFLK